VIEELSDRYLIQSPTLTGSSSDEGSLVTSQVEYFYAYAPNTCPSSYALEICTAIGWTYAEAIREIRRK